MVAFSSTWWQPLHWSLIWMLSTFEWFIGMSHLWGASTSVRQLRSGYVFKNLVAREISTEWLPPWAFDCDLYEKVSRNITTLLHAYLNPPSRELYLLGTTTEKWMQFQRSWRSSETSTKWLPAWAFDCDLLEKVSRNITTLSHACLNPPSRELYLLGTTIKTWIRLQKSWRVWNFNRTVPNPGPRLQSSCMGRLGWSTTVNEAHGNNGSIVILPRHNGTEAISVPDISTFVWDPCRPYTKGTLERSTIALAVRITTFRIYVRLKSSVYRRLVVVVLVRMCWLLPPQILHV